MDRTEVAIRSRAYKLHFILKKTTSRILKAKGK